MNSWRMILLAAVTSVAFAASHAEATVIFRAELTGAQEVPPNGSAATGIAELILNDAMDRLEMSISLFGLDLDGLQTPDPNDNVRGFHIHRAPFGVNGPVVFGMISPNSDMNGDLVIDPIGYTLALSA